MKSMQRIFAITICVLLAIAISGSLISSMIARNANNADPSFDSNTYPPISAVDIYKEAAAIVDAAENLTLTITDSIITEANNEIFSERSDRSVHYQGLGTDTMSALVNETLSIGNYNITHSEFYNNNSLYLTVGDGKFSSAISEKEFHKRNIPAIFFDTSRYGNIEATQTENCIIIKFESPVTPEPWAFPDGAGFISANGSATLDANMQLTMSTYDISYTIGSAVFKRHIETSIKTDPISMNIPNIESYIQIQHIDAPIILEKACGYLMQAQSISANIQDTIVCDAFSDDRNQTISLDMHGQDSDFTAKIDLSLLHIHSSRGGEALRRSENILFSEGKSSVTIDGVPSQGNVEITAHDMRANCQDLLLSTILLPEYISGVSISEDNDYCRFDFSTTPSLAETMCQGACDILYQDPKLLIDLSSDSSTEKLGAYLQIHKATGLPTASGIFYTGNYTIDERSYMLKYETSQTYCIPSNTIDNTTE